MFTWIPAYQKIAQHVALFQNKQPELIAVLEKIGTANLRDENSDGSTFPLSEIDGLSFFRYLNRGSRTRRLQTLRALCNHWRITPLPEDVTGLPEVSPLNVWLFPSRAQRTGDEIKRLWLFFKAVLNHKLTDELFQDVLRINGVGKVKLTEVLFMLRPDRYLFLNRSTRSFLLSMHLGAGFSSLEDYLATIGVAREVLSKSFPEIAAEAAEYIPGSFQQEVAEAEAPYGQQQAVAASGPLNLILYGPPGTGKTYYAIDKALALADPVFYAAHSQQRAACTARFRELLIRDYEKPVGQIAFCTFHQSMSYEDFVEGIKPGMEANDQLQYQIKDGLFKIIAGAAAKSLKRREPQAFVLIIDEINRGNIAAIFGELITLIEENKRSNRSESLMVTLPYSKKPFSVPPNLYLIGTMNTADRSVEALDTALRRRFVFEAVVPQPSLLAPPQLIGRLYTQYADVSWQDENFRKKADALYQLLGIDPAFEFTIRDANGDADQEKIRLLKDSQFNGVHPEQLLAAINKRLSVLLSPDHTIGHAWLMEVYSLDALQLVFKHKLIPLLQEYFFNHYAKIGLVLGNAFVKQEPVHNGIFAAFSDVSDTVNDYTDAIRYTLVDPCRLPLKAFCAIYQ